MKAIELTTAINAIANAISCGLTDGELALVASIFVQIGDTLATIAAKRAICNEEAAGK